MEAPNVRRKSILEASQERLANREKQRWEDKGLAVLVRDLETIGSYFVRTIKMIELHDIENKAFDKPIVEFIEVGETLMNVLGALHIVTVEDQVFVNDIRIRLNQAKGASTLSDELASHEIGGISFHMMPDATGLKSSLPYFHKILVRIHQELISSLLCLTRDLTLSTSPAFIVFESLAKVRLLLNAI